MVHDMSWRICAQDLGVEESYIRYRQYAEWSQQSELSSEQVRSTGQIITWENN